MIYFIVNPVAGHGINKKNIKIIKGYMKSNGLAYKTLVTKKPNHATMLAKLAVKNKADKIIAAGGDGTIQEVAEGVAFSNVPLGVLPLGSGNDLAKSLGIGKNIESALKKIVSGKIIKADLIEVSGRHYLNAASIGIDAEIAVTAGKIKKTFGRLSYFISVFKNIITYKPFKATVKIGNKTIGGEFTLIAAANGKYYGGGFKIAPGASIDDGLADFYFIKKIPRLLLLIIFPTVIFGTHNRLKYVTEVKARNACVLLNENKSLNLDGNMY
ncbi:MAG: diacylglycerol kinase family lipid kinase, partial [Clostridiales bacterium]|nr:diacylglycerol kinase family lipid kinase [Clostridiales bacterium]